MFNSKLIDDLRVKIWKQIQGSYFTKEKLINNLVFTFGFEPNEMNHLIDIIGIYEYWLHSKAFERDAIESKQEYLNRHSEIYMKTNIDEKCGK